MPVTLRTKAAAWLMDHRIELTDLGCLLAAALVCEWVFMDAELPWRAILCALLIADAVPVVSRIGRRSAGRSFLLCLPSYAVVALAVGLLWHFAFRLPPSSLGFIPVWLLFTWVHRVGEPYARPRLLAWNARHPRVRLQAVPLEAAVLGGAFYCAASFVPGFWPNRYIPILACLAWPAVLALTYRLRPPGSPTVERLRLLAGYLAFAALVAAASACFGARFSPQGAVLLAWGAAGVLIARVAANAAAARMPAASTEIVRWILLAVAALWLAKGYASFILHGAGDAAWYAMMLADMLAQIHAGVFPVWMGQGVTQFNGAIYPLRIAPGFHYLGALMDLLVLRSLGVIAVQNLLLTVIGVATILCAYFSLAVLVPRHRWFAAALATVFLACPGILGMAYKSDLFMSWMTLPWVALAWFSTIRSFRSEGRSTLLLLGASLGLCWWGHSPIALWMTLIAGVLQLVRLGATHPGRTGWLRAVAGASLFLAIAAYPIGSVLFYPPEPGLKIDAFQQATGSSIAYFIQQVFPADFLPLSPGGHELSDLQLGYSLWAILLFCLVNLPRVRVLSAGLAFGAALFLALLLLPIPGLNLALWSAVPQVVRNATSNWAMNRLYLPMAGAVVFGAAAMVAAGVLERRRLRTVFALMLAAGCAWSMSEAAKFHPAKRDAPAPNEGADDMLRPENAQLTRFAYMIFPRPPDVFTHGVTDPAMENRLRAPDTFALTASNYRAARASAQEVASGAFAPVKARPSNFLQLDKEFRIEPGRSYLLDFAFPQGAQTHGVVEISGKTFHREYALPEYGGPKAFGAGGEHSSLVALSTSSAVPVDLRLRFFPETALVDGQALPGAIRVSLLSYDPKVLPIRVDSLIPYRARVTSPSAGWLETPRMHQLGYVATVNGRDADVRRSPDGLVWIAVPAGESRVGLDFRAPPGLQALFWFSLAAIGIAAAAAVRTAVRLA